MIRRVEFSRHVRKQLAKLPAHICAKLHLRVLTVETDGLEYVRRVPGYHDEPLQGRRFGQRSVRLSASWRAIYEIRTGTVEFVSVEEVTNHDY